MSVFMSTGTLEDKYGAHGSDATGKRKGFAILKSSEILIPANFRKLHMTAEPIDPVYS